MMQFFREELEEREAMLQGTRYMFRTEDAGFFLRSS
jgi:hypothetical protein